MAKNKIILNDSGNILRQKLSPKLKAFKQDLYNQDKRLIFAAGLPSTGKTKISIEAGLENVLSYNYEKLIIIRPVINPEFGLLPGTAYDKMKPYIRQSGVYVDMCSQKSLEELMSEGRVEIIPADLLQGNRFQNCFVIFDEIQNIHMDRTFAFLSRVGEGCKFVVIGDISRGQKSKKIKLGDTLLDYCLDKFKEKDYASVHTFYDENDILGDEITRDIIITLMEDFV